jgi:hypothetical protein
MNESSSSHGSAPAVLSGTHAFRIGLALLVGLSLMLALAVFDKHRRANLERMEEITAVGDKGFLALPADLAATPVISASLKGQPIQVATTARYKLRDSRMRRIGRDDTTGVAIYEYLGQAPKDPAGAGQPAESFCYVKIAPGEYLRGPKPAK